MAVVTTYLEYLTLLKLFRSWVGCKLGFLWDIQELGTGHRYPLPLASKQDPSCQGVHQAVVDTVGWVKAVGAAGRQIFSSLP